MANKIMLPLGLFVLVASTSFAQELYVNTEPASNMAVNSLGIRAENQAYTNNGLKNRNTLELMYGASKSLMLHATSYASNFYQNWHVEGASVYAKYRFLSVDTVQRHFRGAGFLKLSCIANPIVNQEISLEGDNTGLQSGVVFTQLLHKLALSGSASYIRSFDNHSYAIPNGFAKNSLAWTLSAGYLLLPKNYTDYQQINLNLYFELLGKTNPGYGQIYLDVAPAVQLIFNSVFRVDFSYRTPIYNRMQRNTSNMYLLRLEYNLFNVL